jgi:hypothetical protein
MKARVPFLHRAGFRCWLQHLPPAGLHDCEAQS